MGISSGIGSAGGRPGICTSTTRPATANSYEGQLVYEIDTNYLSIFDGSNWITYAPQVPHSAASGLLQPATTRSTASTTNVDFPGTDLLKIDNFVKYRTDTRLLVTINGSIFSSLSSTAMFAVRVNAIDYDIGMVTVTATSSQYPYSVTNIINVPTAGTYTIQARWRVTSGTWSVNEFSRQSLVVTEVVL